MSEVHQVKCNQCGVLGLLFDGGATERGWMLVKPDLGEVGTIGEHPGLHMCSLHCLKKWTQNQIDKQLLARQEVTR